MSFNKRAIPSRERLVEFLKEYGSDRFYFNYIRKVDAMQGESDGIDFIREFEEEYVKRENGPVFHELD